MSSRAFTIHPTLPMLACTLLLLSACDSTNSVGGGAGDGETDNSSAAIALLAPFSGFYDLQDDWNGQAGDEAFLVIETPGEDAISPVSLYDFDDVSNCLPRSSSTGQASKDLLSTRVFMDDILQFDEAELTLLGNTLTIEFNDDADLNNNGSTLDRVSISALRIGVSQVSDLGDSC